MHMLMVFVGQIIQIGSSKYPSLYTTHVFIIYFSLYTHALSVLKKNDI